jgi:DNA-binding MarR family transcriptional regulator
MKPKQRERTATIERIVTALQVLMLRQMREHAPDLVDIDITMAQTKALYLLVAVGELRMSDLAARLGVTSSTATGLVDRLVELGLATRREPADRRQVVIAATEAARALMERFRELNAAQMRRLLAHVDPADLPVIERAFGLILTAADAAADHAGPADRLEPDAASHSTKGTHP